MWIFQILPCKVDLLQNTKIKISYDMTSFVKFLVYPENLLYFYIFNRSNFFQFVSQKTLNLFNHKK